MNLIIGCGYLGRRVASLWQARGCRVAASTRGRADELAGLGLTPIHCDVLDTASCRALPPAETVLYCVGFDRQASARMAGASMRDVYVGGLDNVLSCLPRPRRFVHVSSTSVYGQAGGELVDESAATDPVEDNGRIVLDAERLLRRHCPEAIVLRFAGIYGPGRCIGIQTVQRGMAVEGDPERWLNLIHVDDGASAVLLAEAKSVPGATYNVSDGAPLRRREYFTCAAEVLSLPTPRFAALNAPATGPNRRISNQALRNQLGFTPRYPTCRAGLQAIKDAMEHERARS